MSQRRTPLWIHLLGAVLASALLAYWVQWLLASAPNLAPVSAAPALPREPDVVLAARMFGDVGAAPAAGLLNVQVSGVFAAGRSSSAVISIDGKPPRAVLLGQELSSGVRLAEVRGDGVTIDQSGARSQYSVPAAPLAQASAPQSLFRRDGATLTAPSIDPGPAGRAAPAAVPSNPIATPPPPNPVPMAGPRDRSGGILPRRGPPPGDAPPPPGN
jgi:general secretion pathway protein C